jgi:predicted glycoside hydrolase/deacetylase ChbG (UPF0249 family)
MHFVLTLGMPLSPMPGLTRDGQLGKWIWQRRSRCLPLEEIARELECQFNRFVDCLVMSRRISTAITTCI